MRRVRRGYQNRQPAQEFHRRQRVGSTRDSLKIGSRNLPVYDSLTLATSSGVPSATIVPPPAPPSGPRSITQSAHLTTSRLCSITTSVLPGARSLNNTSSSLA